MADTGGSDRNLSPKEEERQRVMDERVAQREQVARQRVHKKQAEQARKNAIWAKRTAIGKLVIFVLGLLIAGGILLAVTTWFGANIGQVLSK